MKNYDLDFFKDILLYNKNLNNIPPYNFLNYECFDYEKVYKSLQRYLLNDYNAKKIIDFIFKQGLKSLIVESETFQHEQDYIFDLKINANVNGLSDKDFIKILKSFNIIAGDFFKLFNIKSNEWSISIIEAKTGSFDIKFGINVDKVEINLFKFSETTKGEIINGFVNNLTGENIKDFSNINSLIKSCLTSFLTKNYETNDEDILKYIDLKASINARKVIYKTVKKLPDFDSVEVNKEKIYKNNIDLIL